MVFAPLLVASYFSYQRVACKTTVLDEGDFGIVGMDSNACKKKGISLVDYDPETRIREVALAFYGTRNGNEKWWSSDGGKSDGFRAAKYVRVFEKNVSGALNPFLAWSVKRGVLGKGWIGAKTTEEILRELADDEVFIKTGKKTWKAPYLYEHRKIDQIPWQIRMHIENDKDYKFYSPIIWADDVEPLYGGAGSGLTPADKQRLKSLESENQNMAAALTKANVSISAISNMRQADISTQLSRMRREGLNP